MAFKIFKDSWEVFHTQAQKNLAAGFLSFIDKCVNQANQELLSMQLDGNDAKASQFHRRMEGFTFGTRHKEYKGAVKILCASAGSAIEERAYQLLDDLDFTEVLQDDGEDWDDSWGEEVNFQTEMMGSMGELFPSSFKPRKGGKGSRPDIRLALGDGYEALFDITAGTDTSKGHILGKAGNWLKRKNVPFIAEVYYDLNM